MSLASKCDDIVAEIDEILADVLTPEQLAAQFGVDDPAEVSDDLYDDYLEFVESSS